MIFAEMHYEQHYSEMHSPLVAFLESRFANIQHGLQGDSWIWIFRGEEKVALDTFTSMKHQLKSASPGCPLVDTLVAALSTRYKLELYQPAQLEAHDEIE